MNRLRWQLLIVAVALIAIAILLLGQQPILRAFTPSPSEGGIYIEGLVGSVGRLNPLLDFFNPVDQDIDNLIYSGLVKFDARGNPVPDLAESWGMSVDGEVYNVLLREGLTWHDGEPLTTDDVVFTVNLMRNADMPIPQDLRDFWSEVDVVAFDERNVQFRLPAPFAPFLDYLDFGLLPEHLLGNTDPATLVDSQFNFAPVGSGPYQFSEMLVEGDRITGVVLDAFEGYYDERAFIDQVVFHYYDSSEAAYAAFQRGDVLGVGRIDNDVLPEALADPAINLYSARLPQLSLVLLNLDNTATPYFQELEVRQALMHGINRQWIIDHLLDGQAFIADSPVLPGTWAYNDSLVSIPFDLDQGIQILREAGYTVPAEGGGVRAKEGIALSFTLVHPDDALHTQIAESIRDNWAEMGVQVTLQAVPYDQLVSDYLEPRSYEAALVDLSMVDSPDPDPYPFWHQAEATGGQNYSRWNDRRASEYLEQARVATSQAERARLYHNFQTHFNRELPALLLYYPVYNYGVSAQVGGVSVGPLYSPSDRLNTLPEWFLVASSSAEEEATEPVIETAPPEE